MTNLPQQFPHDPDDHTPFLATKAGCVFTLLAWALVLGCAIAAVHVLTGLAWGPMVPAALVMAPFLSLLTVLHAYGKQATAIGVQVAQELAEKRKRVQGMDASAARREAMRALAHPDIAEGVKKSPLADRTVLDQLGPQLRLFFSEFERINDPVVLDREMIGPAQFPGMICVGDPYGFGHNQLVVKPGKDVIYELDLEEPPAERQPERLAETVWHLIVLYAD